MKILILTPIEDEFLALTEMLCELNYQSSTRQIGKLCAREYASIGLLVVLGGLGKAQFGIHAQHAIDALGGVDLLVCAGSAGGLGGIGRIGDVAVATETIEHDFKWGMLDKPLPRFAGSAEHIETLRSVAPDDYGWDFRVLFGPVASGDEGIVNADRARRLRADTGAIAVAWEGAGGARAAGFSGVPFLEVRGISDGAGGDAPDEFRQNLPIAVKNVARVLLRLALSYNADTR